LAFEAQAALMSTWGGMKAGQVHKETGGEFEQSRKLRMVPVGKTVKLTVHCKLCFVLQNPWQGKRWRFPVASLW